MWNSQNVQLKHEKGNSMSIVLLLNPNCIDRKQQLYSDLEILSKYTTQTCNSTFGNDKTQNRNQTKNKVWFVTISQIIFGLQAIRDITIHKYLGIKLIIFFQFFLNNGISETALHTESESESETGQIRHG